MSILIVVKLKFLYDGVIFGLGEKTVVCRKLDVETKEEIKAKKPPVRASETKLAQHVTGPCVEEKILYLQIPISRASIEGHCSPRSRATITS